MNSQQQQLLQLLQIKNLELHSDFKQLFSPLDSSVAISTVATSISYTSPSKSSPSKQSATAQDLAVGSFTASVEVEGDSEYPLLAADIARALAEISPALSWQRMATCQTMQLSDRQLQTQTLALLSTSTAKRQLWRLLSEWQNQHDTQ